MALPSFDDLLKLTDIEKLNLLTEEAEAVILSAPEDMQDRLRARFNGMRMKSLAAKNPIDRMVKANLAMMQMVPKLGAALLDLNEAGDKLKLAASKVKL